MFSSGPNYQKLTTNLRLSINRLKLVEKKKTEQAVKARKEIADFLAVGKEERARIRVEHIVREDYIVEAMELVEMYCDLLLARMGLIQATKGGAEDRDPGLEEPIASIIWAAPRLQADCQELLVVTEQLSKKYGKEFAQSCRSNQLGNVNEKLMHKLSMQAEPKLVDKYLEEIARTYNVPFTPQHSDEVLAAEGLLIDFKDKRGGQNSRGATSSASAPIGFEAQVKQQPPNPNGAFNYPPPAGQPPNQPPTYRGQPPSYTSKAVGPTPPPLPPNHPSTEGIPQLPDIPNLPDIPQYSFPGGASVGGESVDFDDLTKRFEDLKKRK